MKKIRNSIIIDLYQYDFYQNNIHNNDNININILKHIIKNIDLIDLIIKKNLYNYEINRLNKVDKAIIRLATFELLNKKNSHKIIINEAIELTKKYSDLNNSKQYKFNNKILHLIFEDVEKNKYKINEL
ncbi:transcription termination factor [Candidatus Phytoplasma luffae]|uniref:Transcription termination factor n=1 Tax=Loofah witches'-broom phytoplasma TaxID=35773 RepID=A0A975IM99_LOWBP|nr:transcription antitermination protein NusB [Candidatus Phytoplasma luffae]QTX03218.1 transcription termination factor [Candidatus Phytoplasma luffae]